MNFYIDASNIHSGGGRIMLNDFLSGTNEFPEIDFFIWIDERYDIPEPFKYYENLKFFTTKKLLRINPQFTISKLSKKDESVSFERVIDIGKIDEFFKNHDNDFFSFYKKLSYFIKININVSQFNYTLENYDIIKMSNSKYRFNIVGEIFNQSGDIEDLFKEFDTLLVETSKTYNQSTVNFSELPKDIDFSKKYYSFPINFSVISKAQ